MNTRCPCYISSQTLACTFDALTSSSGIFKLYPCSSPGSVCLYWICLMLLWAGRNGLPPTPDTLKLGCVYHLHCCHRFLSTWGAVMLITPQVERKRNKVMNEWMNEWMLRKATKCLCMSKVLSKPERTSWSLKPQLDTVIIEVSSFKWLSLRGNTLRLYRPNTLH